jgi:tRNA dimethylallyltransferase
MYFQSLVKGLDNLPQRDDAFREKMKAIKDSKGMKTLFDELKLKDPDYANSIKENDSQRVIRALEVIHLSNKSLSSQLGRLSNNSFLDDYHVSQFGIFPNDRKMLHKRIESRLKKIIDDGLVDETRKILQIYNIKDDHPALRAINYKQALSFINNKYDKETFYLKALFATRQFAKRQITWMRSWDNLELFDINEEQKILKMIKNTKEFQSFV